MGIPQGIPPKDSPHDQPPTLPTEDLRLHGYVGAEAIVTRGADFRLTLPSDGVKRRCNRRVSRWSAALPQRGQSGAGVHRRDSRQHGSESEGSSQEPPKTFRTKNPNAPVRTAAGVRQSHPSLRSQRS